ncbi:hypothetical protein BDM02DRAFT_3120522 [Thelephora ganbajun]|uniref:Uncharacterized protein n=1 Tax=Thelephora ganbajun TaxID=370292 RepID=A0ACB6Z671_THEGA|nr:hypothetical protein BDM02DRAFT_3120522 [Thelephora ganbajun]
MENLPLDTSNPAVRDYLTLIRLQVLTPLSLLVNITAVLVCSIVVTPGIQDIEKMFPSSISPKPLLIATYLLLVYIGQVGYCILLVTARKPETKKTITRGVGIALVLANWIMGLWAIAWVMQWFLVSTILLGTLLLILLYCNVVILIYHRPEIKKRPLDVAFIHAPLRFFLVLPLQVMFPYSLFVELGYTWEPGKPNQYANHQWAGFGVVLLVNLIGLIVIVARKDIVWCIAAVWIDVAIWSAKPKPSTVFFIAVVFTAIHPIALIFAATWKKLRRKDEGRIRLPPDDNAANGSHTDQREQDGIRPPREVDTEALWG